MGFWKFDSYVNIESIKMTATELLPSPKDVFAYFRYWQKKVDPVIANYLKQEGEFNYAKTPYGSEVFSEIEDLTLRGGKRQRVAFVAATFGLLNGEFNDKTIAAIADAATGVELLQTQLLIHDDVIDEAPTRRGRQTIHDKFMQRAIQKGYVFEPKRYGNSVGLLAGDLTAYFACYPILSSEYIPLDQRVRVLDVLLRSGVDTFYGQILDLLRDARGTTNETEILDLAFVKAGRSSGEAPMHIGAILAGQDHPDIFNLLSAYVVPVSIAAQLQDDILGVFGDEKKLGKSILSDIAQGKQTLLVLHALENADPSNASILSKLIGNKEITLADLEIVKEIMESTEALKYVRAVAMRYAAEGEKVIEDQWPKEWSDEEKIFFRAVADAAVNREY